MACICNGDKFCAAAEDPSYDFRFIRTGIRLGGVVAICGFISVTLFVFFFQSTPLKCDFFLFVRIGTGCEGWGVQVISCKCNKNE